MYYSHLTEHKDLISAVAASTDGIALLIDISGTRSQFVVQLMMNTDVMSLSQLPQLKTVL